MSSHQDRAQRLRCWSEGAACTLILRLRTCVKNTSEEVGHWLRVGLILPLYLLLFSPFVFFWKGENYSHRVQETESSLGTHTCCFQWCLLYMRLLGGWEEDFPYPFINQKERLHFFFFLVLALLIWFKDWSFLEKKKITKPDFPASGRGREVNKDLPKPPVGSKGRVLWGSPSLHVSGSTADGRWGEQEGGSTSIVGYLLWVQGVALAALHLIWSFNFLFRCAESLLLPANFL